MSNVRDDFERAAQPSSNSRGCLYGCLIGAGIMVALLLCGGGVAYWYVSSTIAKYTSETPVELPQVDYTPEKMAELEDRLKVFSEASKEGAAEETELVLTADDINAMLTKNDDMKGKIFVKIEDGLVSGDVSFPLDGLPGGSGRFFNGSAGFNVSIEHDVLFVTLDSAAVNGEPVPDEILEAMAGENLAKDAYKQNGDVLRRLKDIRIEGDTLILKLKPSKEEAESTTTDEAEATEVESPESASSESEPIEAEVSETEPEPAGV